MAFPKTYNDFSSANGAPFHDLYGMLIFMLNNQSANGDVVVLADGDEGSGKSVALMTLAILLKELAKRAGRDLPFDPATDCIYDHDDWKEVFDPDRRGGLYLIDEGGNLLFSREAMKGDNRDVVKVFQQSRVMRNIMLTAVPNIRWIDVYLRDHRARIRIHCHSAWTLNGQQRGFATVQWRSTDWRYGEPRWTDVFDWDYQALDHHPDWPIYEARKIQKFSSGA